MEEAVEHLVLPRPAPELPDLHIPAGLPGRVRALAAEHGRALVCFGLIGATVFAIGLGMMVLLVHALHLNADLAFLVQNLVAIEINFVLNWKLTWRGRATPLGRAARRFHLLRVATVPANQLIYWGLRTAGAQYLLAMVIATAILMGVNYLACHLWTFARGRAAA